MTDDTSPRQFYHGTRADLKPGALIEAGYGSNYGKRKKGSWVYLTGTLGAAVWGAELAVDDGSGSPCRPLWRRDRFVRREAPLHT